MSAIKNVENLVDYKSLMALSATKLVVIDFTAKWCPPCKLIAPVFEKLSEEYRNVQFAKVDVDDCKDVAENCNIRSMPTFQFFKDGKRVEELLGMNPAGLKELVKKHSSNQSSSSSSSGAALPADFGVPGHGDLSEYIDVNQVHASNEQEKNNVKNILKKDDSYLESESDEQLIINVSFKQGVNIHSLKFKAADPEKAPRTIKIFANNQQTLDFDDVDSFDATQELILEPKDFEDSAIVNLKYVKFQNKHNIILFIADNQGDNDTTALQQLTFIGSPKEGTDMKKLADH